MSDAQLELVTRVGAVRLWRDDDLYVLTVRDMVVDSGPYGLVNDPDSKGWRMVRHFEALKKWIQGEPL